MVNQPGPNRTQQADLTTSLGPEVSAIAPDGSDVRVLLGGTKGSMAHFSLRPGEVSVAVASRTVEELWYFVDGEGEMWRRGEGEDGPGETAKVSAGIALAIPARTHFQFKSTGSRPLAAVGVTMPPWPGIGDMSGRGEVYFVQGPWRATVKTGMRASD